MSDMPPLPEGAYKADLEILDRYQSYSAEMLRISLAGIALLGFFFDKIAGVNFFSVNTKQTLLVLLTVAAVLFLLSSGFALAHRFFSTQGVSYHIRSLRHGSDSIDDSEIRNRLYHRAGLLLGFSAIFCGLAATALVIAIVIATTHYAPGISK